MLFIVEKLPNSNYEVCIDERGIILELHGDPVFDVHDIPELSNIWEMSDEKIDEYFRHKKVWPHNIYDWLKEYVIQLDAEKPQSAIILPQSDYYVDNAKKLGAWKTQMIIRESLITALNGEAKRLGKPPLDK